MSEKNFDGVTYQRSLDFKRLKTLLERVKIVMSDGKWRSLSMLQEAAGGTEASCSARLRDLRKPKFGGYKIERRRSGRKNIGLFEYRMQRKEQG